MALTRDQILGADSKRTESVTIPEWGGSAMVRLMTGAERDAFEEACTSDRKRIGTKRGIRAWLAVFTLCDETGVRMFADTDIAKVADLSSTALDAVFAAAARINRLFKEDVDALEKNSSTAQSEGSGSA